MLSASKLDDAVHLLDGHMGCSPDDDRIGREKIVFPPGYRVLLKLLRAGQGLRLGGGERVYPFQRGQGPAVLRGSRCSINLDCRALTRAATGPSVFNASRVAL